MKQYLKDGKTIVEKLTPVITKSRAGVEYTHYKSNVRKNLK